MRELRRLLGYLGPYRRDLLIAAVMIILETAFEMVIPVLMADIIDVGVANRDVAVILQRGIQMGVCALLALATGLLYARFTARAAYGWGANIREAQFERVQKYAFSNLDKFETSSLVTRMTTDVTVLQNTVNGGYRPLVRSPVMLVMGVGLSFWMNPRLALVFLVCAPVLGGVLFVIVRRVAPMYGRLQKAVDRLNNVVQEGLTAIRAVKAFVRGEYEEEKFQGVNSELMETSQRTFRLAVLNLPVFQLVMYTAVVLIMWLGEQITEKGIGNGISLIIFSGIVVGIPGALVKSFQLIKLGDMSLFIALALVILMVAVLIGVVFMERAQRRIPIQYAKRQVGRKMYGGQSTHLPLRVNTAGVIPPIFASSLLLFPATMANFDIADWLKTAASWFTPSSILYNVIFIALIFFFCFFYTAIIFDPKDVAENLKKAGGFIPGIRPGEKTQEYLDAVLSRLTLWGGVYISVISVLPMLLIAEFNVPFYFGGTSILILVGVAMDFMSQIESHLISRQYEGLMGKTRIKGRS